jgi:hypothetical protein
MIRTLAASLVLAVTLAQERPLSIVLLVDVTSSVSDAMAMLVVSRDPDGNLRGVKGPMSPRDLFVRAIEKGFIANLHPADRVCLGTIARTVHLSPACMADRAALGEEMVRMLDVPDGVRSGPSPLWDAVDAAVDVLEREPGRRAVVLLTDGLSTGNRRSLTTVLDHAVRSQVSVSVVAEWFGAPRPQRISFRGGVGSSDSTASPWRMMVWPFGNSPDANLRRLASATAGVFVADGAPSAERWLSCSHLRNPLPQCAGEDPTPDVALAAVLAHLHSQGGQP